MDICAVQDPWPIGLSKEYAPCLLNIFQDLSVESAANPLRCEEARTLALGVLDLLTRLFKPVATEVAEIGDTISVGAE